MPLWTDDEESPATWEGEEMPASQRVECLEKELEKWKRWAKQWEARAKRANTRLEAVRRALGDDYRGDGRD